MYPALSPVFFPILSSLLCGMCSSGTVSVTLPVLAPLLSLAIPLNLEGNDLVDYAAYLDSSHLHTERSSLFDREKQLILSAVEKSVLRIFKDFLKGINILTLLYQRKDFHHV